MHPCPRCQQTQAAILSYSTGHMCAHKHVSNSPVLACLSLIAFFQSQVLSPRRPLALLNMMNSKLWLKANLFDILVLCSSLSFRFVFHVVLREEMSTPVLSPRAPIPSQANLTPRKMLEELPSLPIQESWG